MIAGFYNGSFSISKFVSALCKKQRRNEVCYVKSKREKTVFSSFYCGVGSGDYFFNSSFSDRR